MSGTIFDSDERRLARAAELAGIGYGSFDIESGQYLSCDNRYAEMIGETVEGMLQLSVIHDVILKRMHPDDVDAALEVGQCVLRGQKAEGTFRVMHSAGGYRFIRQIFEPDPVDSGDLRAVHVAGQDLTEFHMLQESLLNAQKLDAIGQLTGGIAHDFNNILATIIGNLELVRDGRDEPGFDRSEEPALLQAAIDASFRGADLTKSLLSFARKANLQPQTIDVNASVSRTRAWIGRTIPENIEIETSLLAGLWAIQADESALQSALLNLIINARDAMPNGGKLTIETSNIGIDENHERTRGEDVPAGRYVVLAVSDTGVGIAPTDFDRVFEPFFTTKPVGRGTGLGLSSVQGFVKQTGGSIQVCSEPDRGTTFKLYFRAADPDQRTEEASPAENSKEPRGDLIFLVEDEEPVRVVLTKALEIAGYNVSTASTGDEAFARFPDIGQVDLLLTDIVMPGTLQGTGLAKELRALNPALPVIFLSGYSSETTGDGSGLRPDDIRLMKPVSKAELLAAVDKSLSKT